MQDNSQAIRQIISDMKAVLGPSFHPTLRKLEDAAEKLTTEIDTLKMVLSEPVQEHEAEWRAMGLTGQERRFLAALERAGPAGATKERIFSVMYSDRPCADWPEIKIIDVWASKVRPKLEAANANWWIETRWGGELVLHRGKCPRIERGTGGGRMWWKPGNANAAN